MIGLMLPTWFLSMWISNTAATSMMIPIIQAVVHTLEEVHKHAGTLLDTRVTSFIIILIFYLFLEVISMKIRSIFCIINPLYTGRHFYFFLC